MISSLHGVVRRLQPPEVLLEVGGVGYRLQASVPLLEILPADGATARVITEMIVREDAQILYGFRDDDERQRFLRLIRVPGIGAKTALGIVSTLPGETLTELLRSGDEKALTRVPGVGAKTARRLLAELQADPLHTGSAAATPQSEAADAMVRLGWKPEQARRMVATVESEGRTTEEILTAALQGLQS